MALCDLAATLLGKSLPFISHVYVYLVFVHLYFMDTKSAKLQFDFSFISHVLDYSVTYIVGHIFCSVHFSLVVK